MKEVLDKWQEEVMDTEGNICLRSGRQVGKSFIISHKAGEFAANNKNKAVMIIASVERQSYLLFEKVLAYIMDNYPKMIKKGRDRPTKHKICLTNGSRIMCFPTGQSGYGIRGFTIDLLIADEAAFIPEDVWTAVTPMLAVTKGHIILLSTPHGKDGYYYRCFSDESFTSFHVSSEDCPRGDAKFLAREKERMTKIQYAQEYLGEFIDELKQFFPDELIKRCMQLNKKNYGNKYLGVDVARLGKDETRFEGIYESEGYLTHFLNERGMELRTTEVSGRIVVLDGEHNFKKILIDDAGVGGGVFDELLQNSKTKRKVIPISNATKSMDNEEGKKKILKDDLYNYIKSMMEKEKLALLDEGDVFQSFKSIQWEFNEDNKKTKFYGKFSHIVEGLTRACWGAKNKSLNIYYY